MPLFNRTLLSHRNKKNDRNIEIPNRLGNEGARQGPTTLLRPSGATPVRIDEALDLDQVEDLDQVFVLLLEGSDFFGETRKKIPLKPGPEIGYGLYQSHRGRLHR